MSGRDSGWAMPAPPSYQNSWTSGADQPPSYEEAVMEPQSHPFQALAPPVATYSGLSHVYPPLPHYPAQAPGASPLPPYPAQAPGASSLSHSASQRRDSFEGQRIMSNEELMAWWRTVKPWKKMSHSPDTEPKMLAKKVHRVQRAIQMYRLLMNTHGQVLQLHINEMQRVSDAISKAYNALKAAGVTRGTTGAVGGAAAVTGIVLAPFTMGASLAITAVGIGVAAAGGLTKASVKKKASINQDRRALEANVQDYRNKLEDIENCLQFIYTGMEHLGRNNLSILKGADMDAGQVARMLEQAGEVAQGLGAVSRSSDLLRGFAGGIGTFYSKKDQMQLKKGKENKFGKTLHKVAGRLQNTQDELTRVADSLSRF